MPACRQLAQTKVGVAYKGELQVQGRNVQELELTYPNGVQWQVFFDPQTHLIVEEKAQIAGDPREIYYDDYRAVDGVKVPLQNRLHQGGADYAINVTRVGVNETDRRARLRFPDEIPGEAPRLEELFDRNRRQPETDRQDEGELRRDPRRGGNRIRQDRQGHQERTERVHLFLSERRRGLDTGQERRQSAERRRTEERKRKTQKRIEEIQKNEKKKEEKEEKAKEEGKQDKENDDPGIEVFLRVSQFVNPRRERFRGQDVLVFDFEPNPEYKPKNM